MPEHLPKPHAQGAPQPAEDVRGDSSLAQALSAPDPRVREAAWRTWVGRDHRRAIGLARRLRETIGRRNRQTYVSEEDEAQDAWASLSQRNHSSATDLGGLVSNEVAWRATDAQRKAIRRPVEIPTDPTPPRAGVAALSFESRMPAEPSAESVALDSAHDRLRALLARVPEQFRTVVYLVDVERMPRVEVAKTLGMREGTVGSQLHRGREALRESLLETDPEAAEGRGVWTVSHRRGVRQPHRTPTVEVAGTGGEKITHKSTKSDDNSKKTGQESRN